MLAYKKPINKLLDEPVTTDLLQAILLQ